MPSSFLGRHRTICAVLTEIKEYAALVTDDPHIPALCDEAILYAERMSAKLVEYKAATAPVEDDTHIGKLR